MGEEASWQAVAPPQGALRQEDIAQALERPHHATPQGLRNGAVCVRPDGDFDTTGADLGRKEFLDWLGERVLLK
eukprot:10517617-Alexandrium_andersonii.AAC.1